MTLTTERFIEIMETAKANLMTYGWHQGSARGSNGAICGETAIVMQQRRVFTALDAVTVVDTIDALKVLRRKQGRALHFWNDDPERTGAEVLELFDDAIIWIKEHPEVLRDVR